MGNILSAVHNLQRNDDDDDTGFRKPAHYRNREGPKYSVLDFTADYEYRRYEPSTWISAHVSELPYSKAVSVGGSMLATYFSGKNGPGKAMRETCPLTTRVESGKSLSQVGDFTVSMHLPYEWQTSPPAPVQGNLSIQEFPEKLAYVATFEGIARDEDWQEEVLKLAAVLDKAGVQYDKEAYYTAKYEKMLYLGKKRNEVMLTVESGNTNFWHGTAASVGMPEVFQVFSVISLWDYKY